MRDGSVELTTCRCARSKPLESALIRGGTGLAPFMSVIQDPETYEPFEKVILVHGVRYVNEVAYREFITEHLPQNEFFGEEDLWTKLEELAELIRRKLREVGRRVGA